MPQQPAPAFADRAFEADLCGVVGADTSEKLQKGKQARTAELIHQIVYALYDQTEDEMAIVEQSICL